MLTHTERDNSINESTEKIFTGSLDVLNNLDNMRFIENAQNERDIVGTWVDSQSVSGSHMREDDFRSDHSFEARDTIVYTSWQFRGKIKVSITVGGKWEIKKDSLIRYYDKETVRTDIDTSSVSASEDNKEILSTYIRNLSNYYENSIGEEIETRSRTACKGSFNLTHSKLELTTTVTYANGEQYEQTNHLKRK